MAIFGLGKKDEPVLQQSSVPVSEVLRMRQQGLSNNQIVQALQRNGFKTHEIFDALSQADIRAPTPIQGMQGQRAQFTNQGPASLGNPPIVPPFGEETETSINGPQNLDELPDIGPRGNSSQADFGRAIPEPQPVLQPDFGAQQDVFANSPQHESYGNNISADVEQISEAIIEEKWQDLMKDLNKLLDWKEKVEQRVTVLEQRFTDIKSSFDSLQKGTVEKVADYDKSVKDVASEMKALEQVFQKIIPTMTENVNELSRITKGLKSAPQKKSPQEKS
jgi:hypothetical protein